MEFNSTAAASSFSLWKPLCRFILLNCCCELFLLLETFVPVYFVSSLVALFSSHTNPRPSCNSLSLFPRVQFNLYSFQVSISCLPKKWSAAANSLHPVKFAPFSFLFQILYQLLQEVVCCCEFPALCKVHAILSFWLPIYYTKSS